MQKSTGKDKNYNTIDCMKLFMAVLVVAIHTTPFACMESETLNEYFSLVTSLAVPFFFITSGYFLYNKLSDDSLELKLSRIKRWLLRIAKLYMVWTFIYLPFTIYGLYKDGWHGIKAFLFFIKNVLLVGENFMSWPLWYLLAMLVAGILIYIMEKCHFSFRQMLSVGIFFTVIGLFFYYFKNVDTENKYISFIVSTYYKFFLNTRNGFFQGLIYMLLGIGVAKQNIFFRNRTALVLFIVTTVIYLLGFKLFIYPVCLLLFVIVKSYSLKGNPEHYKYIRYMSTIIYFVHMIFVGILMIFFNELNSMLTFIFALILSILFSIFSLKEKDNKLFKICFE